MLNSFFRLGFGRNSWTVYEIYPQSDMPHLTQIAHLSFNHVDNRYLLPGKVIWYRRSEEGMVFRVWDYRVNHSTSFSLRVGIAYSVADYSAGVIQGMRQIEVHFTPPKALEFAS